MKKITELFVAFVLGAVVALGATYYFGYLIIQQVRYEFNNTHYEKSKTGWSYINRVYRCLDDGDAVLLVFS